MNVAEIARPAVDIRQSNLSLTRCLQQIGFMLAKILFSCRSVKTLTFSAIIFMKDRTRLSSCASGMGGRIAF